eukprot:2504025-Pleurochrysis_carterae.AAC.1
MANGGERLIGGNALFNFDALCQTTSPAAWTAAFCASCPFVGRLKRPVCERAGGPWVRRLVRGGRDVPRGRARRGDGPRRRHQLGTRAPASCAAPRPRLARNRTLTPLTYQCIPTRPASIASTFSQFEA